MIAPPDLGVGLVYWPEIEPLLDGASDLIDVLEVEPQPFWFAPTSTSERYRLDRRAFERLRGFPQRKLVHGVGAPIGGTAAPDARLLSPFVESITALRASWASEHLSFNRVTPQGAAGGVPVDTGFLLPPVQSLESAALAASNIRALQGHLPVPFAFETGVSYLRPVAEELSDGAFFAAVADEADCGILLDLHNIWANERNGRQPVLELLDELPLDRVWELHLAGGQDLDGYWVDAHSDLVPSPLIELARRVVPRLPNLGAIIFEIMPEYAVANALTKEQLRDQLLELHELWVLRDGGTGCRTDAAPAFRSVGGYASSPVAVPSPHAWEEALARALAGDPVEGDIGSQLAADPGIGILQRLIGAVRAGKVADSLKLTTRLLLLELGEDRLQEIFAAFWRCTPPEPMASEEAKQFAVYLYRHLVERIPFLAGVLELELAANRALIEGEARTVRVPFEPWTVLAALHRGERPGSVERGEYEVTVEPPAY